MSANISNSSLTRSRSLKLPPNGTFKPTLHSSSATTVPIGPPNVALFLTNLRLLDLDLKDDWPQISISTFSTKEQNQKKRIQAVEWALYQLFAIWDPDETQNKLSPFFPPHEPLQSLNLRNALLRCLDQAKKTGALGRDTVLRKTMLDECKGERLEEVLAVFSNAVLRKVVSAGTEEHAGVARQLSLENLSYHGERGTLTALVLAHKFSLAKLVRGKEGARARYHDFSELLDLNDRRIVRRHEQMKQFLAESTPDDVISRKEATHFQDEAHKNWSGNSEWLESILYGDNRDHGDGLFATRFDKVWEHVEAGSIGEVESKSKIGLLEQLDTRVRNQENRLARWQDFGRTISKSGDSSLSKTVKNVPTRESKIDFGFTLHQTLQIGRKDSQEPVESTSASLEEYNRLIENMSLELSRVGQAQTPAPMPPRRTERGLLSESQILSPPQPPVADKHEEVWSSVSDNDEISPGSTSIVTKSTVQTPPSSTHTLRRGRQKLADRSSYAPPHKSQLRDESSSTSPPRTTVQPRVISPTPRAEPKARKLESLAPPAQPLVSKDSESDLADAILTSMSAASPSPKKQRHTLSLADRTRLSMSQATQNQLSELHDDFEIADLPRLTIRSRPSMAPQTTVLEAEPSRHDGLVERTRKSMAGFEAAQKRAQLERRRSVKEEKKKVRQSNYFPKVEEEAERVTPDISAIELMEGDPDYEDVFKSRPKIKTSPAVSPTRSWNDGED